MVLQAEADRVRHEANGLLVPVGEVLAVGVREGAPGRAEPRPGESAELLETAAELAVIAANGSVLLACDHRA